MQGQPQNETDLQKKTPRLRDWGEAIVAIRRRFRKRGKDVLLGDMLIQCGQKR